MPTNVPNKDEWLRDLDSRGYHVRMHRAAQLGRAAAGSAGLAALLAELVAGPAYEACLALAMAAAARDEATLLEALRHPSRDVRISAAQLVARLCAADVVAEAILRVSLTCRRLILRRVGFDRRQELAERLIPTILARWGATEAALLLPGCTEATVRTLLPDVGHAVVCWHRLAARFADAVIALMRTWLERSPAREWASVWARFRSARDVLCTQRGPEILALMSEFGPKEAVCVFARPRLGALTRRDPAAMLRVLLHPDYASTLADDGVPDSVLDNLRFLSVEQRTTLAQRVASDRDQLAQVLAATAPRERATLFAACLSPQDVDGTTLPDSLLSALSHATRDQQAVRMLDLRVVRENPELAISVTSFRAIEAARPVLEAAAKASKAMDRATALCHLVRCTGLYRRGIAETLAFLQRLKNEQDPVRLAAWSELASVPPSCFTDEHAVGLDALVDCVVQARDTSPGTRNAVQTFALALLCCNAGTPQSALFRLSLDMLRKLTGHAGAISLPSLENKLPRGAEARIVDALEPLLRAANRRESHAMVLALGRALGKRAWRLESFQRLLAPITEAKPDSTAAEALALWIQPPHTRDERVRAALDRDASAIVVPGVLDHLQRKRQEWLDPFLTGASIRGRFLSGKTAYLLPLRSGFHRWLPRQRRAFRPQLERVAADTKRSLRERSTALQAVAEMTETRAEELAAYAASPDVPLAEAALGAMAWVDQPEQALPILLGYLDQDRARVAMYAIPRCARVVEPAALTATLAALLDREHLKITSRKEVVRLLGTCRTEQSLAVLVREWEKPKLHRDVRIAVGHAARQFLDREEAWTILYALAHAPDADLALSLAPQRAMELTPLQRPRYAEILIEVARHSDVRVRTAALHALSSWPSGSEGPVAVAAARAVVDMNAIEWATAASTLVQVGEARDAGQVLVSVAETLMAIPDDDAWNATRERDVPRRQRLLALCGRIGQLPAVARRTLRMRILEIAKMMESDPTLCGHAASLRLAAIPWLDAPTAAADLVAIAKATADDPLALAATRAGIEEALTSGEESWQPDIALDIVDHLTAATPPFGCGILAVTVLAAASDKLSWSDAALARVRRLRRATIPAVRAAALDLFTCSE